MNLNARYLRQYMQYVRPGDVRVEVFSSSDRVKPVAFVKPDGKVVAVLLNDGDAQQVILLRGLPAGIYAIERTRPEPLGETLPSLAVEAGGQLVLSLPAGTVTTLHPLAAARPPRNREPHGESRP